MVTDIVRRTTECDGTSYRPLKNWFQEVEYTLNYTNKNVDLLEVVRGELRKEIETFLTEYSVAHDNIPRFDTLWKNLKTQLFATFIPLDAGACPRFLKGGGPISLGSLKKCHQIIKGGGSNGLMGGGGVQ